MNTDTIYYDKNWEEIINKDSAIFFRPPARKLANSKYEIEDYYTSNGKLQMRAVYNSKNLCDGYCKYFFENGNKRSEGKYIRDKQEGTWNYYYENSKLKSSIQFRGDQFHGDVLWYYKSGQLKRKEFYKFGKLQSGKCYTQNGTDTIYFRDHSYPKFPGKDGMFAEFIANNPIYLKFQKKNRMPGRVMIEVFFDENGRLLNAKYIQRAHPTLDDIAMQIVMTMPNWEPAEDDDGNRIGASRAIYIDF